MTICQTEINDSRKRLFTTEVNVSQDISGRITLTFPYSMSSITKVKTIKGYKWYPDKKYWSFPDSDGKLREILNVFDGERIR